MKREIKFRAWDSNEKRMIQADELVFWNGCCYVNPSKSLHDESHPHKPARLKGHSILEKYIMQFTGLHDKSGKEIYEGDIFDLRYAKSQKHRYTYVDFNKAQFRMVEITEGNRYYICPLHPFNFEKLEVIGNIYENPELLEEK